MTCVCDDCILYSVHDFYAQMPSVLLGSWYVFYLGYFVGGNAVGKTTRVLRRILFNAKSSSLTACFTGK